MDPLLIISPVHKKIQEMPAMYQKILTTVNFYNIAEYVKTLNNFFTEIILPHFDFEERQLFPVLIGELADSRALIMILLQEHRQFREKLAQVNDLYAELEANPKAQQKEKEEVAKLCGEITQGLSDHALKEDDKLFPLFKDSSFFE